MANDKIGCAAGKTILVDPNAFDGQSSLNNISVPLEDLTISVQLETKKKARTVLSTDNTVTGTLTKDTSESSQEISLTFIEGSEVNGKKVLTTKFTDLTTSFDGSSDGESLGITSIDIDFNSSYAPMITIQFIDLRGSSVFQNEDKLKNGINKYSTFFQLPYPIYKLTVKGYYGMPVTYCLHMLKFSAKFNSQTGNFEITANFIGYTYAMLSDMLLGYLKAIPYTKLGADKYSELKDLSKGGNPKLLTLNELMKKISEIDIKSQKIKSTDPNYADLVNGEVKKENLATIKTILFNLGQQIDINNSLDEYQFILVKYNEETNDQKLGISNYTTNIIDAITKYNTSNSLTINVSDFINIKQVNYGPLSLRLLSTQKDPDPQYEKNKKPLLQKYGLPKDSTAFDNVRKDILKNVLDNYTFDQNYEFTVYDLRNEHQVIQIKLDEISSQQKTLQKTLGDILRAEVAGTLGFDPTVRNIINIFTTAVEVWMYVLFQVSAAAGANPNDDRTAQLKNFKGDSTDYKDKANGSTPNNGPAGGLTPIYYPWPDYRVKDAKTGWVEKYLGDPIVGVSNPKDVDELDFMNNLLNAFLKASAESELAKQALTEASQNWIPVNPLDTRLFTPNYPYKRITGNNVNDVWTLMLIRAMTFFGYTNNVLTPGEITKMANAEIDSIISDISNEKVIDALQFSSTDSILKTQNKINNISTNIISATTIAGVNYYSYQYITGNTGTSDFRTIIPISDDFNGNWDTTPAGLIAQELDGKLFLTNYDTIGYNLRKYDDGGIYIKIIDKSTYYNSATAFPLINSDSTVAGNILDLNKLKQPFSTFKFDTNSGFDALACTYGVQEFTKMNYNVDKLENAPYMYMFYQDGNYDSETYNKSNGLGRNRIFNPIKVDDNLLNYFTTKPSKEVTDKLVTPYDMIGTSVFRVPDLYNDIIPYIDGDKPMHNDYGKTRILINDYVQGDSKICYPFINFQVNVSGVKVNNSKNLAPVSLFGSRLYYEQTSEYSKALLFLHTFPWSGLITDKRNAGIFGTGLFDFQTPNRKIFDTPEIINTFANRAGFISAPKLWVAFIGAMLWRADIQPPINDPTTGRQIEGGSGVSDPILFRGTSGKQADEFIPTYNPSTSIPTKLEYITKGHSSLTTSAGQIEKEFPNSQMVFSTNSENYKALDPILINLPEQAKQAFKQVFFDFVLSSDLSSVSDWETIKSQLEIFNGTGSQWVSTYTTTLATVSVVPSGPLNGLAVLPYASTRATYTVDNGTGNNFDNYILFAPLLNETFFVNNYLLELRDSTPAMKTLMDLFTSELIITNTSPLIWGGNDVAAITTPVLNTGIYAVADNLKLYIDTIVNKIKENKDLLSSSGKKKQREQEIFGTSDESLIKFQMYRTCKNTYDKWIGGSSSADNLIFQGACNGRNDLDYKLANLAGRTEPKLIDSFRFVTRSFRDIGDEMVINPVPVNQYLSDNPNSSFYDAVTSLLSSNNFDFIPLPTYINYGDEKTLQSMFKPMSSVEAFKQGTVGPSFVCVYVGQTSKHLDFGDSDYSNDGFDVRCDSDGNMMSTLPDDFTLQAAPHENNVAVFAVNYGQQNQNIFKDIILDQNEFAETAESLQITDDIANSGSESKRSLAGQNIFNVYSVRSYKTEVEMMGNAMIQPMMYFQLNNIPMFHGAYMITHVTHSIKPNHMSTHFTGVRIRKVETPLMDVSELFMSMLDSIDSSDIKAAEPTRDFGSVSANNSGTFKIPNTTPIADLKNKINNNKFNTYVNKKFTQYGN